MDESVTPPATVWHSCETRPISETSTAVAVVLGSPWMLHPSRTPATSIVLAIALVVIASTSALTTAVNVANADEEAPKEDLVRGAQLFELAKKLFGAEEFEEAAKTFEESYQLAPRPAALFNQARCHEEAGNKAAAVDAYRRYIESEPEGDAVDEANTRMLALQQLISIEKGEVVANGTIAASNSKSASTGPRGKTLRSLGLAVGLAGVGLAISGGLTGLKAQSISNEFESRPSMPWTDKEIARFDEGEASDRRAAILMSVGAAAVVGGVVLYYVGHRMGGVDVVPVVTPEGAGANVSVRF